MAKTRTIDFLPPIFQTPINRQFFAATLDQLVQEPAFERTQGFIGRTVGPGVNADDKYVVETTKTRKNYQLEPGVIIVKPDTQEVLDAITYPGIQDALKMQGAYTDNTNRLYTNDFYTWDPFVDFDKFSNFSQYYWLPGGPDSVDVSATSIPLTDNFVVTRENGVYTFGNQYGNNPTLTLVRGGNYTFQVAQNNKETINFRVTNNGSQSYIIDYESDPTLTLVRGNTYVFNLVLNGAFPFWIKTQPGTGEENPYNNGVINNGAFEGQILFTVPQDAPNTLYYACETSINMTGVIKVVDGQSGSGPGFWIQSEPGVNGTLAESPNISSRDVLGVINNGEDLGTVTFNVPLSTAQNFYYTLTPIASVLAKPAGTVDLATNLNFDQINNIYVDVFLEQYGGIDGIAELNNKTVVFLTTNQNEDTAGWNVTTQFDPLAEDPLNDGLVGSYDTTTFDQTTPVPVNDRYSVWQIKYIPAGDRYYMQLIKVLPVSQFEKFQIIYGTEYSSYQFYKNAEGYFERIPLLTAILNTLYYQDGTDPEIFGRIRLIDQANTDQIDINDIIGQKNYTSPNGVTFTNGLKVVFRGNVSPASYVNNTYYIEGVGTAIKLLPTTNFVTPETYTQSATVPYDSTAFDVGNYDASLNQPEVPDYLTINRASLDLNAWTRSNRWFHIDVINASATYNNQIPIVDNNFRAKRPILEFRSGLKLFNYGTEGKKPVDIIDFSNVDAFSSINGQTGYNIDGYQFINGTRVIFAKDQDPQVRNKIYVVQFISPDTVPPLILEPIINLVPAEDADVLINNDVVCLSGNSIQGKVFYYDGVEWFSAQDKIQVNQAPLFDVYDKDGISFSDSVKYFSNTFAGSKLFSYALGSAITDSVLGFPLRYLTLRNVGDIVFDNNLYTDTFVYVDNKVGTTVNISSGFVREYSDRSTFTRKIGWQPAITKSQIRQQLQFTYDGGVIQLDVRANENSKVPAILVYVGAQFIPPTDYTVTRYNDFTEIRLADKYVPGSIVEVAVLSDQISQQGFYQVASNLENNPFGKNSDSFTLGTIRSHYETIGQNLLDLQGPIIGANNMRDLGNVIPYGQKILQQSSPITLTGYFLRNQEYEIFASLGFNDREYIKFKNQLLDNVVRNDYTNLTVAQTLTAAITDITLGKTELNSFYWSDMLPAGSTYTEQVETYTVISDPVFDLTRTYDFTSSNYYGLLVYLNDNLLLINHEYEVATDGPRLTITIPLQVGDVITIQEYNTTIGNFVPNTPTKLGLYQAWKPEIFYDVNAVNPCWVIRGHDGSITRTFGDIRDDVLLEFEKRIYNNLKIKSDIPLTIEDILPGQFRTTDYTSDEITEILSQDFLIWAANNKLDYKTQNYQANNEFTWNYSLATNKLNNLETLLGAWRGIYRYFYDTQNPNLTPWEMLGFSKQPNWWIDRYGPAPYTSNNLVLWEDLEQGIVADPTGYYVREKYKRPGLINVIPVDSEGNLVSPVDSTVGILNEYNLRKSWQIGDGGPVEAAWWNSSSYPFAVMRLLALTRTAEFFSLFVDRDLYKFDESLNQYLYDGRYRLDAKDLTLYGSGVSKASYINWIVDYNQQNGLNTSEQLSANLGALDVRLCYRFGSFTDKNYLKVYTEKSSPNSQNSSLLLPDASYNLLLYKNQPRTEVSYSSITVQKTETGWSVNGYSQTKPYFNILVSNTNGQYETLSVGSQDVQIPVTYTDIIVQVPYGTIFTNETSLVDFLLSYGAYLELQGLTFTTVENNLVINWKQMATEFLYWNQQGWAVNSIINLNPGAVTFNAYKQGLVVDNVNQQNIENLILDQNSKPLPIKDLVITRLENNFTLQSTNNQAISFVTLKYVNFESLMILDNTSIFADLIYDPTTGSRQNRVRISGVISSDWNGTLNIPGFILNDVNTVKEWQPNVKYSKGEIVRFKGNYWSAQSIIQPTQKFNFEDWIKSDYASITKGLLPNIPNKANQLANSYNTNQANLETDNDLLSYGLIGFKPRQYMVDLNLDDVSQINLYQQFLKSKGTIKSAELFKNANFSKEVAEYDIYEYWALLAGTYGANANRSYFEIQLDQALLTDNPNTIQVTYPGQQSIANQTVLLENLWKESYKIPNTDILPTIIPEITDTALPSAGYVDIDDVDITVFSLNNPNNITNNFDKIGIGTKIWVAKSNSHDWNIYRTSRVPGNVVELRDNLDGSALITFSANHNLKKNSIVIIRYFNSLVDGVFRTLAIPSPNTIVVPLARLNGSQVKIIGNGIAFYLDSMRVAQASDIATLDYATQLQVGARAYVDNDGNGRWVVLEKRNPFTQSSLAQPEQLPDNSKFGQSIAQNSKNLIGLIGAPGFGTGVVYVYSKNPENVLVPSSPITLETTGTSGYGSAIALGNNDWGVISAPTSNSNMGYVTVLHRNQNTNSFNQQQLLVSPDENFGPNQFGYSVAISSDERWMYISSPVINKVYAYGLVEEEDQYVKYVTDGSTFLFNYSNSLQITNYDQVAVLLGNRLLTYADYSINSENIIFVNPPLAGQLLTIVRKTAYQLDHETYLNVSQNATSGSGTGAKFTVDRTRGVYYTSITSTGVGYSVGNTLTIYATAIGGGTVPANNLTITVTGVDYTGAITNFTTSGSGVSNTAVFPISPYLATVTDIYSFTVLVNGILQRPHIDYDFNSDSATDYLDIVFNAGSNPAAGATIIVRTGSYYKYVQTLTVSGLPSNAQFGFSIATGSNGRQVLIGAPGDTANSVSSAGSVYMFNRDVTRYIISNTGTTTYALPAAYKNPVTVKLNNEFLTNAANFLNGQYTIVGNNVVLSSSVELNTGDILEIENNIFQQVQKITANNPSQSSNFGFALDICPTNCSLYVGAPNDTNLTDQNIIIAQSGSVERNVNQSQLYGVIKSTIKNPSLTAGHTISINYQEVAVPANPNNTVAGLASAINSSGIPNVLASVDIDGYLTISVKDIEAAPIYNKLFVLPGLTGTAFSDCGFQVWAWTQKILSPVLIENANFGYSLNINDSALNLIVGAPGGTAFQPVTFDDSTTYFDSKSTSFFNEVIQSGVAYTYDYFSSASESIDNPGQFAFGQQIYNENGYSYDKFGTAVNYTGSLLWIGAPGYDAGDSAVSYGEVVQYTNNGNSLAWQIIHEQRPVVDVNLLNSVYIYNKIDQSKQTYLDFIDPLQGKILGAARQNIDYIGSVDPALYNVGTVRNNGNVWGKAHVGQIWWDTNRVRFIDPNQNDISYASRRWSQVFPGSNVDVYQWVESLLPPTQYKGSGVPLSTSSYSVLTSLNSEGIFVTNYYFWVRGVTTVNTRAKKTLSTAAIAVYIENPRNSGIPYLAALNENTVALYNSNEYIIANDSILHVEYDRIANSNNVHSQYELIADGVAKSFLNPRLYTKLQDSFCGSNLNGAPVPDPFLPIAEKYGVQVRPRQSMFANRFSALKNYLTYVNNILIGFPTVESRSLSLLNSSEPQPTQASGVWDMRVANLEELSYQNINAVPIGYRYLVDYDSGENGLWTIYEVNSNQLPSEPRVLDLVQVQNYDTKKYWYYTNWYLPGYNSAVQPVAEVPVYSSLETLTLTKAPVGSSVKVTSNSQGKFEIYQRTETSWLRVGLEDGTLQISNVIWDYLAGRFGFDSEVFDSQYFDQEPVIETRKIIQAINEQLLIDELLIERNRALILMFNFILSEFAAPYWIFKTSLIDVDHKIRELAPYQIYKQDNQTFVQDYIQEVKPYHVQVKEYHLTYNGFDIYQGDLTDFDLPAYYNTNLRVPQYTSPILLPYTHSTNINQNDNSDLASNSTLWTSWPYSQWYNNYLLEIVGAVVTDGGVGYTEPPIVEVEGDCIVPATFDAVINSAGKVVAINILTPGQGYSTTAILTLTGGNGTGAKAVAVMGNPVVRQFNTTIKYDRYQYYSTIVDWEPNVTYDNGTMVRYNGRVWEANSSDSSGINTPTFIPEDWAKVPASTLSGVDRTMGFYLPTANEPGLDLALIIDGIDYPGVQVKGPGFDQNSGFGVDGYDTKPFDNVSYGPEGYPTYDPGILDASYSSQYLDTALGTRPTDINVDGGAYIDNFNSHAPEELIPGIIFDTLDMRVYTRPGADWTEDGHGFPLSNRTTIYNPLNPTISFADIEPYPVTIHVFNETTGVDLYLGSDYTVDWINQTITIISANAQLGDNLMVTVYEIGGGNQLLKENYNGAEVGNRLVVPVAYDEIQEFYIVVNGTKINTYTYADAGNNSTQINFTNTYSYADAITLIAIGPTTIDNNTINYSWSVPTTQYIVADGNLTYNLVNSLEYTNPDNIIVTVNGIRARQSAGIEYFGDGSTEFLLPSRLGFSQALIADNEVHVYVDSELQIYGIDYVLEPYNPYSGHGDRRAIQFINEPALGSQILIYVTTNSQCFVNGSQLIFSPSQGLSPSVGDIISVITWNDTRQQNILTQVFVGPEQGEVVNAEKYDTTTYDVGTVSGDSGSFDYSQEISVTVNNLILDRLVTNSSRIWVTVNGKHLFPGQDFNINGYELVLTKGILNATDTVIVTLFTESVVPEAMAFRIFQNMRGLQVTYRITSGTTTVLTQDLPAPGTGGDSDVIYVENADALAEPNLAANIWGTLTIGGERIFYRYRDTVNNTVSGLNRGVSGTGAATHAAGAIVYNESLGNLLPVQYQNYPVVYSEMADGTNKVFVTDNIYLDTNLTDAVEVYVGGILQNGGYEITSTSPVTVNFDVAPIEGRQVDIMVLQGVTWYDRGVSTPSDGHPLQEAINNAARFLRGTN